MDRAYSILTIKSIDPATRRIRGMASTPKPDRMGDIVEPLGATFAPELPLLLHHRKETPVGVARLLQPTAAGIEFEAELPIIDEPGAVKDEVDRAWHSITNKLIRGISIGFRVLDDAIEPLKSGGLRLLKTEILELSLVTVPANRQATLSIIKELDLAASHDYRPALEAEVVLTIDSQNVYSAVRSHLAATGLHAPGDTGPLPIVRVQKAALPMTTPEQITQFSNDRAAKAARLNAIMVTAADSNSTLDAAQTEDYDTLALEVKSIDAHLARLRDQEKMNLVAATPITATTTTQASDQRGGSVPVITVKSMLPKGTAFTRYIMAVAAGKGDSYRTLEYAKQWHDTTPEVETMVTLMPRQEMMTKAAIAAGSTTDATWAGPLAAVQPLVGEFLELLRPRTLIGRIPGLRHVPFNVSVPSQTTGGTYGWVGQNKPKPVTKADYATVSLTFAKAAGIIVLTEELVKLSTPSAEALVREEMIAGMGQFLDLQFQDPAVAAVANVNPASITNGAATAAAGGVTGAFAKADFAARVATFTAAGIPLEGSVWLMSDSNAFGLGLAVNALGQPLFPGVGIAGGSIMGMPVVVSNSLSTRVVLLHAPSILIADDGGVSIDVSREASVQMDSAPTDTVDATTVYVSLWQRNLVGLKAERWVTWLRARTAAVTYITAAAYNGS